MVKWLPVASWHIICQWFRSCVGITGRKTTPKIHDTIIAFVYSGFVLLTSRWIPKPPGRTQTHWLLLVVDTRVLLSLFSNLVFSVASFQSSSSVSMQKNWWVLDYTYVQMRWVMSTDLRSLVWGIHRLNNNIIIIRFVNHNKKLSPSAWPGPVYVINWGSTYMYLVHFWNSKVAQLSRDRTPFQMDRSSLPPLTDQFVYRFYPAAIS